MRLSFTLPRLAKALALTCGLTAASAAAADFPSRPIRIVVSQQAGGATDQTARMWAESVGKTLGTPVIVENRPGAGGTIAAQFVLSQTADGHTLFLAGVSQMVLNKFVYKPLSYSPEKDFSSVGMLTTVPFVLVSSPASGLENFEQLREKVNAKPEAITFASSGNGNSTHLVVELLMKQTGMQMLHIPFRGEPDGLMATIAGTTDVMAPVVTSALPLIKQGKITPLLVFADARLPELPDVPTAAEIGVKGLENIGWSGIAARSGTPPEAIEKLHQATQVFLAQPAVLQTLSAVQAQPMPGPADMLQSLTERDTQKWQEAIGDLDIKLN